MSAASVLGIGLIGLLWGLNWPAVKFMLTEIEPLTVRAVAFPMAALVLAIIARSMGQSLRVPRGEIVPICVAGFFVIFAFNGLTSLGQTLVEASKAAIIAYTMPAITAVLAARFLGERIDLRIKLALGIGMAGLGVLAAENLPALVAAPAGPAIMLLAALSWSIGNVVLKARQWSAPPLVLTAWLFVAASLFCWPVVLVFEAPWAQSWPSAPILWTLAFHILGPMVISYLLWTVLLGRLPATVAAIATLTAPVVGVVSAVILLGESMSWYKGLALAMIVVSISVTLLPRRT